MATDWRLPYRSMDASGSPETAGAVGLAWIEGLATSLIGDGAGEGLWIDYPSAGGSSRVTCLYRGTHLLACATVFRDQMNFAVLVRWRLPEEFDCDRCNMAEPSRIGCLAADCPSRIGRYIHEGWPTERPESA